MRLIELSAPRTRHHGGVAKGLLHLFRGDSVFRRSFGIRPQQFPRTVAQVIDGAQAWCQRHDAQFWVIEWNGKVAGTAWAKSNGQIRCDLSRPIRPYHDQVLGLIGTQDQ